MSNANKTQTGKQSQQHGEQPQSQGEQPDIQSAESVVTASTDSQQVRSAGAEAGANQALDLAAELENAKANYLRAKAEIENVLKRTRREIEEQQRYAALPVVRDLLAVVDNLHRAIEAAQKDDNAGGLLEGVKLVEAQLRGVLDQHGCKPIKALGEPFDPNLHDAIGQEPSNKIPPNHVSRELQIGYQLYDRVVRPSQVFVSTGPTEENTQEQ